MNGQEVVILDRAATILVLANVTRQRFQWKQYHMETGMAHVV